MGVYAAFQSGATAFHKGITAELLSDLAVEGGAGDRRLLVDSGAANALLPFLVPQFSSENWPMLGKTAAGMTLAFLAWEVPELQPLLVEAMGDDVSNWHMAAYAVSGLVRMLVYLPEEDEEGDEEKEDRMRVSACSPSLQLKLPKHPSLRSVHTVFPLKQTGKGFIWLRFTCS